MEKSIGTPEYQRLCRHLRRMRERAGLTQAQLAAKIDERQSFVSTYESGGRRLDIVEVRRIAEAIGTPAAPVVALLDALTAVMDALDEPPSA